MTIPFWPSALPRPERDTWSKSPLEARVKKRPEAGPPSYRRRFSGVAKTVHLSTMITRAQKAIFDDFYENKTSFGSKLFTMPDPTTDGWALLDSQGRQMLTSLGVPILLSATWLCFFGDDQPVETVVGMRFRITFTVAVMP